MNFRRGCVPETPCWQALIHQAPQLHPHRGDAAMVLTNLGHSPGELDAFDYFENEGIVLDINPESV